MRVESVHNIIGWFANKLRLETRRTFHYDKGNDVTVVERRDVDIQLYNKKGEMVESKRIGSTEDKRV